MQLDEEVELQYYRLQKINEGRIDLTVGYGIVLWHILAISLQTLYGFSWPAAVITVLLLGALYTTAPWADVADHLMKYHKLLLMVVALSLLSDPVVRGRCRCGTRQRG